MGTADAMIGFRLQHASGLLVFCTFQLGDLVMAQAGAGNTISMYRFRIDMEYRHSTLGALIVY